MKISSLNLDISWTMMQLKDLCTIDWGNTSLTKSSYVQGGKYLAVSAAGCDGRIEQVEHRKYTPVLSAIGANCGRMFLPVEDFTAIKNTITLSPKVGICDGKFLFYLLSYSQLPKRGAGQPFISKGDLETFKVLIPRSFNEQRCIADIFDRADELRTKRHKAIEHLKELKQSIFLDMFGDPVTNIKGEKIVQLSEITTRITDGVHQKPNYTETGVPFISVKDITTGKLTFDDCKFISLEDHQKYTKRCKAEYLDILYTKVGATYGRPAIVDTQTEFSLYVSVCLIKPKKELVNPYFLSAALGTSAIKNQADRRIKGIGVPDLHLDQIQKFLLPLPSLQRQSEFADRIMKTTRQQEIMMQSLSYMNNLFSSLHDHAFKGELSKNDSLESILKYHAKNKNTQPESQL